MTQQSPDVPSKFRYAQAMLFGGEPLAQGLELWCDPIDRIVEPVLNAL